MVTIPLAWLASVLTIIAGLALALNPRLPLPARIFLGLFLLSLATAAGLLGLRLTYGVLWAARVQPHFAMLVAPLAFLGFRALTQEGQKWRHSAAWPDLAAVAVVQLALLMRVPATTDLLVTGLGLIYLLRLAFLSRLGGDAFVHVPPASFGLLRAALFACLIMLGLLVAVDLVIALALLFGGQSHFRQLLSGASGIFAAIVLVIALVGVPLLLRRPTNSAAPASRPQPATGEDEKLLNRLDGLMRNNQLYVDSTLTLARVARRLSVPARDVSGAVNRGRGENFSRYVNGHRIAHARDLLAKGTLSVTDVMLEAGFVSKSSFNAEFRRITGKTPSECRAAQPADGP